MKNNDFKKPFTFSLTLKIMKMLVYGNVESKSGLNKRISPSNMRRTPPAQNMKIRSFRFSQSEHFKLSVNDSSADPKQRIHPQPHP